MTKVSIHCNSIVYAAFAAGGVLLSNFTFNIVQAFSPGIIHHQENTMRRMQTLLGRKNERAHCFQLPAISINVRSTEDTKPGDTLGYSGSERFRLNDKPDKASLFNIGINDSAPLKSAVAKFLGGKNPNNAYTGSPTPWNDLYNSYGWSQVYVELVPIKAVVLEKTSVPQIVSSQTFENDSPNTISCNANIQQSVKDSVTTGWTTSRTFGFEESIKVGVNIEIVEVSSETKFSASFTAGESETKSVEKNLSAGTAVTFDLQPGQKAKADLQATQGILKCRVTYEQHITGRVAANFDPVYQGHHFWSYPVTSVVEAAGGNPKITVDQDIEVGFFTEARVLVTAIHDVQSKYEELVADDGEILADVNLMTAPLRAPHSSIPEFDDEYKLKLPNSPFHTSFAIKDVDKGRRKNKKKPVNDYD